MFPGWSTLTSKTVKLAIHSLENERRRLYAVGHFAYKNGDTTTWWVLRDEEHYQIYTKAIEELKTLSHE